MWINHLHAVAFSRQYLSRSAPLLPSATRIPSPLSPHPSCASLNRLVPGQLCSNQQTSTTSTSTSATRLTLNLPQSLFQQLPPKSRFTQLRFNRIPNTLNQRSLLRLPLLLLIPNPTIQDSLELRLDRLFLLKQEVFMFERVCLLCYGVELFGKGDDFF